MNNYYGQFLFFFLLLLGCNPGYAQKPTRGDTIVEQLTSEALNIKWPSLTPTGSRKLIAIHKTNSAFLDTLQRIKETIQETTVRFITDDLTEAKKKAAKSEYNRYKRLYSLFIEGIKDDVNACASFKELKKKKFSYKYSDKAKELCEEMGLFQAKIYTIATGTETAFIPELIVLALNIYIYIHEIDRNNFIVAKTRFIDYLDGIKIKNWETIMQ